MSDRHDYVALDWVKGEIEEVLKQAQYELEAYVESPDDIARMKFCLTYLHQVRGTLQMVEFYGAAMLAEEMEALAQSMINDQVSNPAEAREVLMQAILQLPNYLEHVKLGHRDLPVVLLPVLNDLRGARGESLLSETSLFQPHIAQSEPLTPAQSKKFTDKQFMDLVRKLRQMYQVALLGLLKGKDVQHNLEYLQKVAARLNKLLSNTPDEPLWNVAQGVLDGVMASGIQLNSAIKELLKQLEPELKRLVQYGPSPVENESEDLLKNLLFYVAKCEVSTPRIDKIKLDFNLADALPSSTEVSAEREALSGPDRSTMNSVASALIEEIATLKEKLDVLVQDKVASADSLSELLPGFKQVADTMGMLGLGTPRKVIQDQFETLTSRVDQGQQADNTQLMDIAGALLYVEASLAGLSDKFSDGEIESAEALQLDEAQHVVLRESKQIIENVKELIVDYDKQQGELSLLGDSAELLMSLRGTLIMVPQTDAANIARACSNILQKHVDTDERPSSMLLDALAESLSGIEYYIERLDENVQHGDRQILVKARAVILPYMVSADLDDTDGVLSEDVIEEDELIEIDLSEGLSSDLEFEEISLESDSDVSISLDESEITIDEEITLDLEPALDVENAEFDEEITLGVPVADPLEELEITAPASDEVMDILEEQIASEPALAETDLASLESANEVSNDLQQDLEDDDDLIDDEIIEIFLEEAQEVLETIEEFWPQYKAGLESGNGNEEAMITTRRAFHTLKGSGRMVSAEDIGETAWSIENMFNRVIDNTIELTQPVLDIIDYTIEQIPALITAFEKRQAHNVNIEAIQAFAHGLSKGEDVGEWQAPQAVAAAEPETVVEETATTVEAESQPVLDPALLEVFSSEVEVHLALVQDFIETAEQENYQNPITDDLQRALHTLKGSAHMAHIESIADIAGVLENFAKDLGAYRVETSAEIVHLFIRGKDLIDEGYQQLNVSPFNSIAGSADLTADVQRLTHQLVHEFHQRQGTSVKSDADTQVLSIFLTEGMDIIDEAEQLLDNWQGDSSNTSLIDTLISEVQTLERGAMMADLLPVVTLCEAIQEAYQSVLKQNLGPDDGFIDVIKDGHEALLNMMDMVAASQAIQPVDELMSQLLEKSDSQVAETIKHANDEELDSFTPHEVEEALELDIPDVSVQAETLPVDIDPELLEIFLEEAEELIDSISTALEEWKQDHSNLIKVAQLQRDLHTFKGGARMAEINAVGDLAHELEELYEGLSLGRLTATDQLFDLLHVCHDRLDDMVVALKQAKPLKAAPELITAIQLFIAGESLDLPETQPAVETVSEITPAADEPESVQVSTLALEADVEVVEIFMDEAEELMEELDNHIQAWQGDPDNSEHNEAIQRVLHTIKGGARIAGLNEIGDLSHDMETELQKRLVANKSADGALLKSLHDQYDLIANRIDSVVMWLQQGAQGPVTIDAVPANEPAPIQPIEGAGDAADSNVVAMSEAREKAQEQAAQQYQQAKDEQRKAPQEMIKVPADLLDGLVNLAGETSISRGRLETQVTDFGFTLEEMDATLDRLRDQLRRLDMETEAQVLFRREQQGPDYEDFDPLEMDRYSQLQQLSRSLVESASDLVDIKSTLLDKTRDAETLLLQQSRVNTELQEGLMKTRMVPFSRLVPRLRRIVRQVSTELGKQVELNVSNAEGEMDRSVLERLISPLEHMLRNAVDHGMESADQRETVGKNQVGNIRLDLSRDGGDVVLRLSDDGAGINLEAVRNKAIERGLLEQDAQIDDHEILQFILQAGFSTAAQVTQISGRGVGMDVVNSEIKQVGGSIVINSQQGVGTEFVIRLPFTVSVNRALMTKVGDALFAIPLNSIEGIVRVSANNLRELYKQDKPVYQYAGNEYQLEYLGRLLEEENHANLPDDNTAIPVVLVRGAQPAAVQVDTLMGSREIVVKALGPQFNSVVGVSGGTILGDGSVVIILDLPNMMRHINSLEYKQHVAIEHLQQAEVEAQIPAAVENQVTSIMVVDDSVTVRKVTTRLLERHGYEVQTAKDGVDAMATLQDYKPDLVLLDIEMPRMDGFEVATQMRHSSTLKDIPIIMITSRTGDKHKERAMAIGVTEYMGKPFQEDVLLEAISQLTGSFSE